MEYEKELGLIETGIPGLVVLDLAVHGDNRGWFKENWQRAKMTSLGLPDIRPVQNNVSFNTSRGATRGIHAEPWDKFVSLACGKVFGAWVDLRPGETFGKVFTCELDPSKAIFVPRGVGNSFQTLEDSTAYTYLVDAHWSLEQKNTYTFVNLADPELAIDWPIPLEEAELSEADKNHPLLADVTPMRPKRTLVVGCNGQLGRALRALVEQRGLRGFEYVDADTFDIADPHAYSSVDWNLYGAIINAAGFTDVDAAETSEGRACAWRANAQGPALLARVAAEHGLIVVHVSSDYVFDGTVSTHTEDEALTPLGVYGQTKAAGDIAIMTAPKHYVVRTSWIVGDGKNFVKTMAGLSKRCLDANEDMQQVSVVDDQWGRPTFADDVAEAILHLVDTGAPYGVYNVSSQGPVVTWKALAEEVFELASGNGEAVVSVSTDEYRATRLHEVAPRPLNSALALDKIRSTGYMPSDWRERLSDYVRALG